MKVINAYDGNVVKRGDIFKVPGDPRGELWILEEIGPVITINGKLGALPGVNLVASLESDPGIVEVIQAPVSGLIFKTAVIPT